MCTILGRKWVIFGPKIVHSNFAIFRQDCEAILAIQGPARGCYVLFSVASRIYFQYITKKERSQRELRFSYFEICFSTYEKSYSEYEISQIPFEVSLFRTHARTCAQEKSPNSITARKNCRRPFFGNPGLLADRP